MTDSGTIKSYDDNAGAWARRIRSRKNYAHEYLEKPAMYGKLPDLAGLEVLCIGCGSGEECDRLKKLGAAKVVGIDISRGLIEQAKYAFPGVEFLVMDMEKMNFPDSSFDFIYSSLTLHYAKEWTGILRNAFRILRLEGRVLFSTHHPIKWGAESAREGKRSSVLLGYYKYDDEKEKWEIFGDYLNTRRVQGKWFDELEVAYYHKPLSEILREIRESGFVVSDFLEPKAAAGAKKIRPDFYEIHQKIPLFMIFELFKTKE
ncbi:MAG: class I SAM-dependent methyltransferase [Candidatus Saccharibacteria bacterium]